MLIQSASPLITAKQEESKSKAFKSVRQRQQSREIERDRELRRGEEGIKIEKKEVRTALRPTGHRCTNRPKNENGTSHPDNPLTLTVG